MYNSQTSFVYLHKSRESIGVKAVKRYLRLIDRKNSLVKIFETREFKHQPAPIPKSLTEQCEIREICVKNRPVWILKPTKNASDKLVFFSHGGGHLNNITSHHWNMVRFLIEKTGATFIVPDYPLLPDTDYKDTYEMVEETFFATVEQVKPENLVFLGDSAGGAISLALAQILRDQHALQPGKIILISPELDASKLHEDMPAYEEKDVMLTSKIFDVISPYYVKDCPRDFFMVSPGLGNLQGLGEISIFAGTHDILFPYALDLKKRLEVENHPFRFYEYPKMFHVWAAVTFLKEAKAALSQMADLIVDGHYEMDR